MLSSSAFAETSALMGDPARAGILFALLDGRALTATELAGLAGVTPQTASSHLGRLVDAGLLAVERQGRHRYHRLASAAVAQMLETVMSVSSGLRPAPAGRAIRVGPRDEALRHARTCYDHLAGRIAVGIADVLRQRGHVDLSPEGGILTGGGAGFLREFGAALPARSGRVFCRPCLDWSERRPHIAGAVGAAICARCFELGWVRRVAGSRALTVTPLGRRGFADVFGIGQAVAE